MQHDGKRIRDRKADFSSIYVQPDPRQYFRVLNHLQYQIPQRAVPIVQAVLAASRRDGGNRSVLDLCCSYGINSAMLYSGDPDQVAVRYASPEAAVMSPAELAMADRQCYPPDRRDLTIRGLDASAPAIGYALRAGLITAGWAENLETNEPSPGLRAGVADTGLIISTGGFGYVGRATFERLLRSVRDPNDLWLVVFVLRVFDYAGIGQLLGEFGLVTERLPMTFRQRRFADTREREAAIHDVLQRGLDPAGKEEAGWYHAECFLTRPPTAAARTPLAMMLGSAARR